MLFFYKGEGNIIVALDKYIYITKITEILQDKDMLKLIKIKILLGKLMKACFFYLKSGKMLYIFHFLYIKNFLVVTGFFQELMGCQKSINKIVRLRLLCLSLTVHYIP